MTAAITETLPGPGLVVGIDVGKSRLDASAGGGQVYSFANDGGWHRGTAEWLSARNAGLVVCEPTGGYEAPLGAEPGRGPGSAPTWPIPTRCGPSPRPADGWPNRPDRRPGALALRPGLRLRRGSQPEQEPEREEVPSVAPEAPATGGNSACRNATAWTGPGIRVRASTQRHIDWLDQEIAALDRE